MQRFGAQSAATIGGAVLRRSRAISLSKRHRGVLAHRPSLARRHLTVTPVRRGPSAHPTLITRHSAGPAAVSSWCQPTMSHAMRSRLLDTAPTAPRAGDQDRPSHWSDPGIVAEGCRRSRSGEAYKNGFRHSWKYLRFSQVDGTGGRGGYPRRRLRPFPALEKTERKSAGASRAGAVRQPRGRRTRRGATGGSLGVVSGLDS